jgi:predicted DNA-binding protein (UPF0251 family)
MDIRSSKQGENMAADELETIPIGDKQYATLQDAARYLGISKRWLENMILLKKMEATQIESRQFIELETLIAYAEKRNRPLWERMDKFRRGR